MRSVHPPQPAVIPRQQRTGSHADETIESVFAPGQRLPLIQTEAKCLGQTGEPRPSSLKEFRPGAMTRSLTNGQLMYEIGVIVRLRIKFGWFRY